MKTRVNSKHLASLILQKNYLSWLIYGLSTLFMVLLQVAPNVFPTILNTRPIPLVVFVICVAVLGGARTGTAVGVLAGLLVGVFSFHVFAFDAIVLMLFGLIVGLLVEWYLRANFFTAMLLSSSGILLHILIKWIFCYVIFKKENVFEVLFKVLLPSGIYTLFLMPLIYMLCYLIARFIRRRATV